MVTNMLKGCKLFPTELCQYSDNSMRSDDESSIFIWCLFKDAFSRYDYIASHHWMSSE
jgi:hypothetical protein